MLFTGSKARFLHDVHDAVKGFGRGLVARVELQRDGCFVRIKQLGFLDPQIVDYLAGAYGLRLLHSIC